MPEKAQHVKLTISVPAELADRFKEWCEKEGRKVSTTVQMAMRKLIEE